MKRGPSPRILITDLCPSILQSQEPLYFHHIPPLDSGLELSAVSRDNDLQHRKTHVHAHAHTHTHTKQKEREREREGEGVSETEREGGREGGRGGGREGGREEETRDLFNVCSARCFHHQ